MLVLALAVMMAGCTPPPPQPDLNVDQIIADLRSPPPPTAPSPPTPPDPAVPNAPPMSAAEADFMRRQIVPCWNFDAGIAHPERYAVAVDLAVSRDGRVTEAKIGDEARAVWDAPYRAVAESAVRSLRDPSCQPLHFPAGKYWPRLRVVFDLEKAINGGY